MLILGGLFALNAVSLDVPLVTVPTIAESFSVESGKAQLVIVLFLIGHGVGHIPAGLLGDRFGRRPVIVYGMFGAFLMSCIAAISSSLEVLLICRFVQGVFSATAGLLAKAMVRDVASGNHASRLNSNALAIVACILVFAPVLGGYLLHLSNWRIVLSFVSMYLLIFGCLFLFRIPETRSTFGSTGQLWSQFIESLSAFYGSVQSIQATLIGSVGFATYFIFAVAGASVIVDVYGLPASSFGMIFSVAAIAQFFAALFNSRFVVHRGAQFIFKVAFALTLFGVCSSTLLAAFLSVPLEVFVFIAVIFTVVHGMIFPNAIALTLESQPKSAGFAAAIFGVFQAGVGSGFGLIVTQFYDGRVETILWLYAAFGSVMLVLFLLWRKNLLVS